MELAKLTKLSDLKKKQATITSNWEQAWGEKKKRTIEESHQEFKDFFAPTKFSISSFEDKLKATYNSITIILSNSEIDSTLKSGSYYLIFELAIDIDEPEKIIYKIPADKYNQQPSLKRKFRVRQYHSQSINEKIDKIEQSISEIKSMLLEFKEVRIGFGVIKDDTPSKNILENKQITLDYSNFKDALANIFT